MKKLLFETNISKMHMVILLGITVLSLVSYYSYAMFTVNKEKENAITIITGNLTGLLKVDGTEANSLSVNSGETKTFTVELSNSNERKARYNFYYIGSLPDGVTVGYVVEEGYNTPPSETGVNLEANGTMGSSNSYRIKVKNSSTSNVTINLGYQVGLDYNDLTLPSNSYIFNEITVEPIGPLTSSLLATYTNPSNIITYANGDPTKMYVFSHTAGSQQTGWSSSELTDYRYIGNSPNNYVTFNDELWRIIGVFTVDDGTGKKEQRIKIIRDEGIGKLSWDETRYNWWGSATLQTLLNNGDYYNRTGSYASTGLTSKAKEMIDDAVWYLGGTDQYENLGAPSFYAIERGNVAPSDLNFTLKVGLMYPSDYMYTYAYGVSSSCYQYGTEPWKDCTITVANEEAHPTNGWLYDDIAYTDEWTIMPGTKEREYSVNIDQYGYLDTYAINSNKYNVRPCVYLKSDVEFTEGDGSLASPFNLYYSS